MSLSDVSKMLDHNAFEHLQNKVDASFDSVSDKYLIHDSFLGKSEDEIESHLKRLDKLAKEPSSQTQNED